MRLSELEEGSHAVIQKVYSHNENENRLYELGLIPGTEIKVIRHAAWSGPMIIKVMNYELCIRRNSASHIQVKEKTLSRR